MVNSTFLLNIAVPRISRQFVCKNYCNTFFSQRKCSSKSGPDPSLPSAKEMEETIDLKEAKDIHWEYHQPYNGHVYSLKPLKVRCISGRIYLWCSCGYSKSQPFCDGTHRVQHYKITMKPVPFTCKETKDYWFCNCKQTKHRPFCDGSHRELNPDEVEPTIRH